MPVSNLQELLEHEIQDLYSAETQIITALPKMITAATDQDLQTALRDHLEVTKEHVRRLDKVAELTGMKTHGHVCEGIKGILTEGEKGLKEIDDSATKDAAIIVSAQRVEHYEIAGYGGAAQFAHQLDLGEVEELLKMTLEEEKQADADLTGLAEGGLFTEGLNEQAVEG